MILGDSFAVVLQALAVGMLGLLCIQRKQRRFHLLVHSAYCGQSMRCRWPTNCDLTRRWVMNAWLFDLPPARRSGQNGRHR